MPPRIARSSLSSGKSRKRQRQRALDALPYAEAANPEKLKIKRHRLGNLDDASRSKRRRTDDLDNDDSNLEGGSGRVQHQKRSVGDIDDLDVSSGSDGEGNRWKMGEVDDDDDSDIDSDEAFGDSDEERFAAFTFRGSAKSGPPKKQKQRKSANREEVAEDDSDNADGEDLGDEAVDLATMLDNYNASSDDDDDDGGPSKRTSGTEEESGLGEGSGSESEEGSDDGGYSDTSMSDVGEDDPAKLSRLQDLITSLPVEAQSGRERSRNSGIQESSVPTNLGSSKKLDLSSFGAAGNDPFLKKLYQNDVKPSKRNGIPGTLDVPLPKRQQDRLDRVAAAKKTHETLDRWTDTVKHHRRAEHISFPLKDPTAPQPKGESTLLPTSFAAPFNDLESTIQNILQESGLSSKNGKDAEEAIREFEELKTNKMPLEEVQKRRAELRKARELMFREEIRAKRIKKIKSKAYRRVHRKERERLADQERTLLAADGVDVSEDEREYNDRRRAEERMGAKHRDSKWAKGVKSSGRSIWDEDARSGVVEMARRNDELRKRIEGKSVRDEDEDGSDIPSSDENEDSDDDDPNLTYDERLERQLSRLSQDGPKNVSSNLSSMAFMQRAEAARKAQNDMAIEDLRQDLYGGDINDEGEDEDAAVPAKETGRRKFGLNSTITQGTSITQGENATMKLAESEHREGSDRSDGEAHIILAKNGITGPKSSDAATISKNNSENRLISRIKSQKGHLDSRPKAMPKVSKTSASDKPKRSIKAVQPLQRSSSVVDEDGWTTVHYGNNDDQTDVDSDNDVAHQIQPAKIGAREFMQLAFAGDEVGAEFHKEKEELMAEEDEKIVDETLPGWGSWVGEGLSKREQKRNKGRILTKKEGLKPSDRKDSKLDRVIINERRVKKNAKYLATTLPHQFETKEQYERSLHLPKGREWNTKQTFQDSVKPRVLIKPGIILPPEKPMI